MHRKAAVVMPFELAAALMEKRDANGAKLLINSPARRLVWKAAARFWKHLTTA